MCGNVILSSRIKEDFPGEVMFEQRGRWSEGESLADTERRTFPVEQAEAGSRQVLGVCIGMSGWSMQLLQRESKAGGRNLTFVATGQSEVAETPFPYLAPLIPQQPPGKGRATLLTLQRGDCTKPLLAELLLLGYYS